MNSPYPFCTSEVHFIPVVNNLGVLTHIHTQLISPISTIAYMIHLLTHFVHLLVRPLRDFKFAEITSFHVVLALSTFFTFNHHIITWTD